MCTWDIDFELNRFDNKLTNKCSNKNGDLGLDNKSNRNNQFQKQMGLKVGNENKSVCNLRARTQNKQAKIKKAEKEAADDFSATE